MFKKTLIVLFSLAAALIALVAAMFVMNPAPAVRVISAADAARQDKPFVVKIHARWCVVCMATKGVWSEIENAYSGRVNLLVLDVTNQATADASRAQAKRLGLEQFFDEYSGGTGTIVVLDGRTKSVTASINGSRDFAEYRAAIDATLKGVSRDQ